MIIAGAGGAAHLPGMVASMTPLPVIGVPVKPSGSHLDGMDALLSIVQVSSTLLADFKLSHLKDTIGAHTLFVQGQIVF